MMQSSSLTNPIFSTFDLLVKSGHMRMVLEGDIWKLHNTRTKDLDLLKEVGYEPDIEYNPEGK